MLRSQLKTLMRLSQQDQPFQSVTWMIRPAYWQQAHRLLCSTWRSEAHSAQAPSPVRINHRLSEERKLRLLPLINAFSLCLSS